MSGIGQPQYRCREMPQSRNRYCTRFFPRPRFSRLAAIASTAAWNSSPENSPEFTVTPYSPYSAIQGARTSS